MKEPTIRSDICDKVFLNVSKALNIFVKRHEMVFEEVEVTISRLQEEWNQKKMPLYIAWAMEKYPELFHQQVNKPESSGMYK